MMTLTKELSMHQPSFDRVRRQKDLCGPYISDAGESRPVRCYLQIAGSTVAVDVPSDVLGMRRVVGPRDEVVLRVPGEELAAVEVRPIQTKREQRMANQWIAEMEDFDRF